LCRTHCLFGQSHYSFAQFKQAILCDTNSRVLCISSSDV
jgi:hypothetical protein